MCVEVYKHRSLNSGFTVIVAVCCHEVLRLSKAFTLGALVDAKRNDLHMFKNVVQWFWDAWMGGILV